jgi:hypothetical protein
VWPQCIQVLVLTILVSLRAIALNWCPVSEWPANILLFANKWLVMQSNLVCAAEPVKLPKLVSRLRRSLLLQVNTLPDQSKYAPPDGFSKR